MDKQKEIIRRIEDGFVFDEHGRWIYMAEQRIYEKRVIEQIVNGNVLFDGKWVAIGEARRRTARGKVFVRPQAAVTSAPAAQAPPVPVTPLLPPLTETASFEAVGDMMETICMDMSSLMKPQEPLPAADPPDRAAPDPMSAHVDSVLIYGLSQKTSAADQSRHAMEYIDEINISRKRGGMFGKLAKMSIALAVAAAVVLVIIQYMN